jgi:hypothetical protein
MTNDTTAMRIAAPNMAAGEEKCQWSAENGFWTVSNLLSIWLASKLPLMCFLKSMIIAVNCSLSWWLKSWDRDIVQPSHELTISFSSDSSAEMRWSIVGMCYPCVTVTVCPDLIVIGESVPALGHTWFVAMVPIE